MNPVGGWLPGLLGTLVWAGLAAAGADYYLREQPENARANGYRFLAGLTLGVLALAAWSRGIAR